MKTGAGKEIGSDRILETVGILRAHGDRVWFLVHKVLCLPDKPEPAMNQFPYGRSQKRAEGAYQLEKAMPVIRIDAERAKKGR